MSHHEGCATASVYVTWPGAPPLNVLFQSSQYHLTNYISNRCFSDARRDSYGGLIPKMGDYGPLTALLKE